jgi:hypothetical protein
MEPSELLPRIGTFFILIGLGLMILFVGSVIGNNSNILYLLLAIVTLFLGLLFRRRRKPHVPTTRFGAVRKAQEQGRKRREERSQNKKK